MIKNILKAATVGTLAIMVVGCASFDAQPSLVEHPFETQTAIITVENNASKMPNLDTQGFAKWTDVDGIRRCHITLRNYPAFLGHEVTHCFQGDWHKGDKRGEKPQEGKGFTDPGS